MNWQKSHEAILDLIDEVPAPNLNGVDLDDVCLTASDLWIFPKGMSMRSEEVLRCWKLVEYIRRNGFPEKLA